MRQAASAVLRNKEREAKQQSQRLREEFLTLAKSRVFPGITGRVRHLEVRSEKGEASILLGSFRDNIDLTEEEGHFYIAISTQHPAYHRHPVSDAFIGDPDEAMYITENDNPAFP